MGNCNPYVVYNYTVLTAKETSDGFLKFDTSTLGEGIFYLEYLIEFSFDRLGSLSRVVGGKWADNPPRIFLVSVHYSR